MHLPDSVIYLKKLVIVLMVISATSGLDAQPAAFKNNKRILFLGNSITYAGNYITDIEAFIKAKYPRNHYQFINMGLPSETVSGLSEEGHAGGSFARPDLHERIDRVLTLVKPDLVFICYGMNDGIYLPFDSARFNLFKKGLTEMHDRITAGGASIIYLTPPDYDDRTGTVKGYEATLDKYADWVLQQQEIGWRVIDIHYPMKKYKLVKRTIDSSFSLAADGVHPGETGHWIMAKSILIALGETSVNDKEDIRAVMQLLPHGSEILQLVTQRQSMMKDAWLTAAKHTRPGMNTGIPLEDALKKYQLTEQQIDQLEH